MTSAGSAQAVSRLDFLLDAISRTHLRVGLALALLALTCFLPGIASLPALDRDESRYAQATKQMLETGDFVDIRFQDAARHKKPVGIYWAQAAAVSAGETLGIPDARTQIALYRVPSLIGALGTVLLTYWAALAFVTRCHAFLAAACMAVSLLLGIEARMATTDALMCMASVAAMGAFARIYLAERQRRAVPADEGFRNALIFWVALAGTALLKGPVIATFIMLAGAALAIADRSAPWIVRLKPILGIVIVLAVVAPWLVAVNLRTDGAFLQNSVGHDLLGKIFAGQEGHGAPPGYYWLLFWIAFWPAAPLAAVIAPLVWQERTNPAIRFLLAWIVPNWLLLELVITKLPHYVLPLYPAVAILIGCLLEHAPTATQKARFAVWLWPIVTVILLVGAAVIAYQFGGELDPAFWVAAVLAALISVIAVQQFASDGTDAGLVLALVSAAAASLAFHSVLPTASELFAAPRLVEIARHGPCPSSALASAGFNEPSLVFYGGTDLRFVTPRGAAEFLREGNCRIAFVSAESMRRFQLRATELSLAWSEIGQVESFNYSNGRFAKIYVIAPDDGNRSDADSELSSPRSSTDTDRR